MLDGFLTYITTKSNATIQEKISNDLKPKCKYFYTAMQTDILSNNLIKGDEEIDDLVGEIYDLIRVIKDPEKPQTLEELNVVFEDGIKVTSLDNDSYLIRLEFTPTVPHCSLATLIGLCLRMKLERNLSKPHKLDIFIREGTHDTEEDINKQINDKERVAAAMENSNLRELVETCIEEVE